MDSLERNLENLQLDMGIESNKHVPLIYKNELEWAQLSGFLPTLLTIAVFFFLMKKSASMMGGVGKRGGLFGGVMQSTAKLVNPSEIDVRFK